MNEETLLERITVDPEIFSGKPIIRGRRLAVEHVLGMLASGDSIDTILEGYPLLEREDVMACLVYARRTVGHERVEPMVSEQENMAIPGGSGERLMGGMELLEEKREEILRIAERYGVKNVRVFGSTMRGADGPGSDLDLLVDLEPGRNLFDLGGFLYEVQELMGVPVDVVTEKGLREHVRPNVISEASQL